MKEIVNVIKKSLEVGKSDKIKFEEALDLIDCMVFYTDIEGKIFYLNQAFANYLGESKKDIIGKKEEHFLGKKTSKDNKIAYKKGFLSKKDKVDGRIFEVFKSRIDFFDKEKIKIKIFTTIKVMDC